MFEGLRLTHSTTKPCDPTFEPGDTIRAYNELLACAEQGVRAPLSEVLFTDDETPAGILVDKDSEVTVENLPRQFFPDGAATGLIACRAMIVYSGETSEQIIGSKEGGLWIRSRLTFGIPETDAAPSSEVRVGVAHGLTVADATEIDGRFTAMLRKRQADLAFDRFENSVYDREDKFSLAVMTQEEVEVYSELQAEAASDGDEESDWWTLRNVRWEGVDGYRFSLPEPKIEQPSRDMLNTSGIKDEEEKNRQRGLHQAIGTYFSIPQVVLDSVCKHAPEATVLLPRSNGDGVLYSDELNRFAAYMTGTANRV